MPIYTFRNKKTGKDEFFVIKEDIESVIKPGKNIVFLETKNTGFASNVTSILASLIQKENKRSFNFIHFENINIINFKIACMQRIVEINVLMYFCDSLNQSQMIFARNRFNYLVHI